MARDYVFTGWAEHDKEPFEHSKEKIRYITWGRENTKEGKKHYQGFVVFNRTYRIPGAQREVGLSNKSNFEARRGTRREARDYCQKEGDFYEWGKFDGFTKEELFKQPIGWLKENYPEFYCRYHKGLERLQNIESPKWRDINVTVLWGEPGTFKSRRARLGDDWYSLEHPFKWFDGYYRQKRLIIDDFSITDISPTFLKRLMDGYPLQMETKGGHIHAHWTEIVITTNEHPEEWMYIKGLKRRINTIKECKETRWCDVTCDRAGGNNEPQPDVL